jgi:PhzF family phenazine biosynthesis protein
VDAFSEEIFGGNQAGVVWLDGLDYPDEEIMIKVADELRYSETAFIKRGGDSDFETRYFTPVSEVDLCGHATIGAFHALLHSGIIEDNKIYTNLTNVGEIRIEITDGFIYMESGEPMKVALIDGKTQLRELYKVMGLEYTGDADESVRKGIGKAFNAFMGDELENGGKYPEIISTGLKDIIMPVADVEELFRIEPNMSDLSDLSEDYGVVGVHAFTQTSEDGEIHVRNFAPLYGIDEEAATGTANSALAYYLYMNGLKDAGDEVRFIQGETMGRPSEIRCRIEENDGDVVVMVGGRATVVSEGELYLGKR